MPLNLTYASSPTLPIPGAPLREPRGAPRIHDAFVTVAARMPRAIAVRDAARAWSYADLDAFSAVLAARLLGEAAGDQRTVAILGRRSPWLVASMLACSKAGLTFTVLDAAYPDDRLRLLLERSKAAIVLAVEATAEATRRALALDERFPVLVAADGMHAPARDSAATPATSISSRPAYLLFTSGTTGVPRCIQTPHAPLAHFIDFYARAFAPQPGDRFSMLSGLSHDPLLRDVFVPLSIGGTICVPEQADLTNPERLAVWVREHRINFLHATPQLLRLLCAGARERRFADLRNVFSGGDVLHASVVASVRGAAPAATVVNFYGATETPQAVAWHLASPDDGPVVPIGRGIDDVQILVLTEDRRLAPVGEIGEVAVRTHYRSDGYLGDEAQSAARFVRSPFTEDPRDVLYLTGDRGEFRPDGAVLLHGRVDDQVKIRGFRVEPGEVALAVEKLPGVTGAAVLAQAQPSGENALLAFVIAQEDTDVDVDALRAAVAELLPAYMVPARVVQVGSFPLLPNGKLDRPALLALAAGGAGVGDSSAEADAWLEALSPPLRRMVETFTKTLGVRRVDPDASFQRLGGDSLSYVMASIAVEDALGHLPEGWEKMPLRQLVKIRAVRSPLTYSVAVPVLVRAVSIVLVVFSHYTRFGVLGDVEATIALFATAGWSFATYQLDAILQAGRMRHVLLMVASVAVPSALWTLANHAYKGHIYWESVLGVGYLFGFASLRGYWFVEVLLHVLLLLTVVLALRPVRRVVARDPYAWAIGGASVLALLEAATRLKADSGWALLCEGFSFVLAGAAIPLAGTWLRKLGILAFLVVQLSTGSFAAFPLAAIALVTTVNRIPLPVVVARLVAAIAAASLFIYLTHQGWNAMVLARFGGAPTLLGVGTAVLFGIIVSRLWNSLWSRVLKHLHGAREHEDSEVASALS
jgi:amino acid adenylation domain-containing protein